MSTTHAAGAPARSGSTERTGELEQGGGRPDDHLGDQHDQQERADSARVEPNASPERVIPRKSAVAAPAAPAGPRRVKLTVSRIDPWSAMKISFLLSVAAGIAGVVLMSVLWLVLSGMGVFSDVNRAISEVLGHSTSTFNLMDYIGFDRVVSLSIVIGVVDIVLLTALATLGAVLYNICASLVGGLQVTLTDD